MLDRTCAGSVNTNLAALTEVIGPLENDPFSCPDYQIRRRL